MTALISLANSLKSLIIVRSLGRQNVDVTTTDNQLFSLASTSKYSKHFILSPSPLEYPNKYIHSLIAIIKKFRQDVLIPVHSKDTYLIAKYKTKLDNHIKVPLHDYATMMKVNNKGLLIPIAEELGIPVPKTFFINDIKNIRQIAEKVDYPAVIKLRNTASSIGLSYVFSSEELISTFKNTIRIFNLDPLQYPLIQEYIVGDGYGVSLLFNQSELRAKFTHKRIREYPITGGPSTCRISVNHSKMEKFAIELMKFFNWHGVAMVEFKLDKRTNKPVLMEVNPRFWGSLNQAVMSGVNFPYLLYLMALDGDIRPVLNYKVGIITRNTMMDFIALWKYTVKTKKIALLKEFFTLPVNDDVISLDDPRPILSFIRTGLTEIRHLR